MQNTHELDDALWGRTLTHDLASQLVGETVQFLYPDAQGQTLAANVMVKALAEQADAGNLRQFNLSLFGPAAPMLIQRTYRMQHAGLGDFAVFISPVARTADGFEYQACFSHER